MKQKENQVKIAERILKEEKVMEQKRRLQPQLFATEKSEAEKVLSFIILSRLIFLTNDTSY